MLLERQSAGLGDRFLDAIEADVQTLKLHPGIHMKVEGFYRMLIERFPLCALLLTSRHLDRHLRGS